MPAKKERFEAVLACRHCGEGLPGGPETVTTCDSEGARIIRIPCASLLNVGMIFEAIEMGASQVKVMTCGDLCRFNEGDLLAGKAVETASSILEMLGWPAGTVRLSL